MGTTKPDRHQETLPIRSSPVERFITKKVKAMAVSEVSGSLVMTLPILDFRFWISLRDLSVIHHHWLPYLPQSKIIVLIYTKYYGE
jgi:hypothetical protein